MTPKPKRAKSRRTIVERVAVVEYAFEEHRRHYEELLARLEKIDGKVSALASAVERYRGTWGGVMLILTAVGVFLSLFRIQLSGLIARLFK